MKNIDIDKDKYEYSYADDTIYCKKCGETSSIDNPKLIYCHACGY